MARKKKDLEERFPWERQVGETSTAYADFCSYRDQPYSDRSNALQMWIRRDRSLKDVAKERGITPSAVETTSSKYRWKERVAAYDDHMDEINRQKQEADIISMRELHASIAKQMVKKAAQKFLVISESDMSVSDAIKMFEVGVKYERLSRGDTTDNQKIDLKDTFASAGMASLIKSLNKAREKMQEV